MIDKSWLATYLRASSRECVNIYCTTCGAMAFRRGLLRAMGRIVRLRDWRYRYEEAEALEVVEALVNLEFDAAISDEPIRLLIFDACAVLGESSVAERLGDSWAGSVLRSMQEHYAAKVERQRRHDDFNSPDAVATRKRAKDQAREQRLIERRDRKAELDARWFSNRPSGLP